MLYNGHGGSRILPDRGSGSRDTTPMWSITPPPKWRLTNMKIVKRESFYYFAYVVTVCNPTDTLPRLVLDKKNNFLFFFHIQKRCISGRCQSVFFCRRVFRILKFSIQGVVITTLLQKRSSDEKMIKAICFYHLRTLYVYYIVNICSNNILY